MSEQPARNPDLSNVLREAEPATDVVRSTGAGPGESVTADVTESLGAGDYVLLCPLAGKNGPHYKLGQLEEFAIE